VALLLILVSAIFHFYLHATLSLVASLSRRLKAAAVLACLTASGKLLWHIAALEHGV
jgi:hypothetical protein